MSEDNTSRTPMDEAVGRAGEGSSKGPQPPQGGPTVVPGAGVLGETPRDPAAEHGAGADQGLPDQD